MNIRCLDSGQPSRILASFLSIIAILAMALPGSAGVSAQEANPRIVASMTFNWFRAVDFTPNALLDVAIYDAAGGESLWNGSRTTDDSGYVHIGEWEHPVNIRPGTFIVISDGTTTKELELEAVTLDTFDTAADLLSGMAPAGRFVWVGTGNDFSWCSMDVTADPVSGAWTADFTTQDPPCDVMDDMWGAAQIFDADGDASEANPLPDPSFVVFPDGEWYDGNNWPDDAEVAITVLGKDVCTTSRVSSRYFFNGGFPEGCDIVPGDVVTFTDGVTTRTHTVRPLTIEAVDKVADTVSGTADTGEMVHTWVHEYGYDQFISVTDGNWTADFGAAGLDLVENMGGRAEIRDGEGNATAVDWWLPNPHFVVFPEWEWYDGLDWPDGAAVDITVEGKEGCTTSGASDGNFFNGGFPEGCDVQAGDTVIFSDGITTRQHTVLNLDVTAVDAENNIVAGTADTGARVYVWAHANGQQVEVTAGEDGTWSADLSEVFDVAPGDDGRSQIYDEQGNATAVDWHAPKPHFTVFPEWEFFDGLDWPDGATVTITVDGKPECETTRESWGGFFNGNFGEGCDLVIGDTVTFTDGATTRTHTVQSLAITKVNQEDNIVKGTAGAGAEIHVWPHATGQELLATANPKGKWDVDFTGIYDLVTGDGGGRAQILDEQGNATAVDWNIPSPRLIAFPAVDEIYGFYWPDGSIVNLSINDTHVAQATAQGAPWDPNEILALFNFGGLHDLAAGDELLLSGHDLEISYTVQNLGVTAVNEAANIVTGTAAPGAKIMVYPFEFGDQPLFAIADENGDWFADFGEAGIDLVPGMCGRSDIFDEFANSTTVDWCLPGPERIIVHVVDNWFRAESFPPDTSLHFAIYDAPDGNLLLESETAPTDANGEVTTWVGNQLQIEPGQYIVVSDGSTTKSLVLEPLTFDVFDLSTGYLQGTLPEPFGRIVSVGIGCWDREDLTMHVFSDESGIWVADFHAEIPNDFGCAFAWTYDDDGDASEARPPAP